MLACQLSLAEQYDGRRVIFELGFCSEPDSLSLAEQYEGKCDGDEDSTVLYSTLLHFILLLIITVTFQSSLCVLLSALHCYCLWI